MCPCLPPPWPQLSHLTRLTCLNVGGIFGLAQPLLLPQLEVLYLARSDPGTCALLRVPKLRALQASGDAFFMRLRPQDWEHEAGLLKTATSEGALRLCSGINLAPMQQGGQGGGQAAGEGDGPRFTAIATQRLLSALGPWAAAPMPPKEGPTTIELEMFDCTGEALAAVPPATQHLLLRCGPHCLRPAA